MGSPFAGRCADARTRISGAGTGADGGARQNRERAGERRSDTANTAVRDTTWHTKGIYGALRISPGDAASVGCETGDLLRLTTRRASADVVVEVSDMMAPGHISLPNGTGIDFTDASGNRHRRGVAPNEFTDSYSRDFLAGTPWHKHIPAKLEKSV